MKFPEISEVEISSSAVVLELHISQELEAFKGHFDEAPIIPGVVQIHWVVALTKQYFGTQSSRQVKRIDALKFQHVIQPNEKVMLTLNLVCDKLLFSFESDGRKHSSGKLIFDESQP